MAAVGISKKRVVWTNEEMRLTLGYYFFIFPRTTSKTDYKKFALHLRECTGILRTFDSIGLRLGNYKSVDPRKKGIGLKNGYTQCKPVWDACINSDYTPKETFIREFANFVVKFGKKDKIYTSFLTKYESFVDLGLTGKYDEMPISSADIEESEKFGPPVYKPETVPKTILSKSGKYQRDIHKSKKSIANSSFKCNLDEKHVSFETKSGKMYMEAHHLIPLSKQKEFSNSLDVDANIICLCPNCHRKLHHGKDIEKELKVLFEKRKIALSKSGLSISFEQLLDYYK